MNETNFLMYKTDKGNINVDVILNNETIWLTQKNMAKLFCVNIPDISKHLANIYNDNELEAISTISKMEIVQNEGTREVKRTIDLYNLDAIIAVGYRVNSKKAIEFSIWATKILKEYIIKGFALNDEKLKGNAGGNYWKELLLRIKDIRSSEKVLYRQVLDLYATAIDYDPNDKASIEFFKIVQNKLHFAAHGHTASEVIYDRANADKSFMGLTAFKGELPVLSEVVIAKNYLSE